MTELALRIHCTLASFIALFRQRLDEIHADERGEGIPATVAWIAGMVVLALAVVAIITAITKSQASSIVLH